MALEAAYKQFLAAPTPAALSEHVSLHYITTLTTFNDSASILKHLKAQSNQIKKKEEKILDTVEGQNALAVEVETTLEFLTSGGTYLPGLDDNFISDRTVTFPIIHIVSFDSNGKITQIRQNWDQGSLLKLLDVIGKTGRNWPIRDGKDQANLIANSVQLAGKPTSYGSESQANTQAVNRSRDNSAVFAPRDERAPKSFATTVPTRVSAKPTQRDFNELFVGHDSDEESNITEGDRGRSSSPGKPAAGAIAPKGGAGKNYQRCRIFDNDDNSPAQAATLAKAVPKNKRAPNWNFADFTSPVKHVPGKVLRAPEVQRQWGNEGNQTPGSPVHMAKVDKPRKDAEAHFEFADVHQKDFDHHFQPENESSAAKEAKEASQAAYDQSQVQKENADIGSIPYPSRPASSKGPLSETSNPSQRIEGIKIAGDGMGGRKGVVRKTSENLGINIGGDGMGGRKGAVKSWSFGGDSDTEEKPRPVTVQKDSVSTGGDFWNY